MRETEIMAILKECQPLAQRFGPNGPGRRKIELSQSEHTQLERFALLWKSLPNPFELAPLATKAGLSDEQFGTLLKLMLRFNREPPTPKK